MWTIEDIPDSDKVFYRIHVQQIDAEDGKPKPGAFRARGEGNERSMSTDWEKYSTPFQSRDRARNPKDNAIVSFVSGELRSIDLSVVHSPDPIVGNRSHADVKDIYSNKTHFRRKLRQMYTWEIEPSN